MSGNNGALHKGHRKRMKEQFLTNGLDIFTDHQALELLLFYAIPQGDTNELAHIILNEFGGKLCNVIDADPAKLCSLPGVSTHTAVLLKLIPQFMARYRVSSFRRDTEGIKCGTDDLCEYFSSIFCGITTEEIHAAALNADLRPIRECRIAFGSFGKVNLSPRKLVDFSTECMSNRLILAHNHPGHSFIASRCDMETTRDLIYLLGRMDIELVDHIIIGTEGGNSMRSSVFSKKIWDEARDMI